MRAHFGFAAVMTTRAAAHGERLGERVFDEDAADLHAGPLDRGRPARRATGRPGSCRTRRSSTVEVALEVVFDVLVVRGPHVQPAARRRPPQLAFLDDEHAALDDVPRRREHPRDVGVRLVDGDVGVGADAEMSLVAQAEQPRRTRARDDGDLVQRVLAREAVGERAAGEQLRVHPLELLVAIRAVHQQPNQPRVRA